jgi:hypothetical protein
MGKHGRKHKRGSDGIPIAPWGDTCLSKTLSDPPGATDVACAQDDSAPGVGECLGKPHRPSPGSKDTHRLHSACSFLPTASPVVCS